MVAVAKKRRESTGFGVRLRAIREAAGLSQGALGERAEMAPQTVAKYERGASEPTWPVVLRLAAALGVTADQFQVTEPPPAEEPPPRASKRK